MRVIVLAAVLIAASLGPASAWWQYAEWGLTESQLASASGGRAVPCRPGVPVCRQPPGGLVPTHYVESLTMVGMPASASFAFDGQGRLDQTVVVFPNTDLDLMANLLQGIHGEAVEVRQASGSTRVWRDNRRGTVITATPVGQGVTLLYRPAVGR